MGELRSGQARRRLRIALHPSAGAPSWCSEPVTATRGIAMRSPEKTGSAERSDAGACTRPGGRKAVFVRSCFCYGPTMRNRVFGLDVLRASAIVMVLVSHARFIFLRYSPRIDLVRIAGFYGVELFFVLSGFLIGGILVDLLPSLSAPGALRTFWFRRWMRTLPSYYLFFLLNIALAAHYAIPRQSAFAYLFFGQNFAWRHPGFFGEAWSLSVEEWFYLLFPSVLFIAVRRSSAREARRRFLGTALVFLAVPFLLRWWWVSRFDLDWAEDARKTVVLRLDAVMWGVCAAWVKAEFPDWWLRRRAAALRCGAVILVFAGIYFLSRDADADFGVRTWLFSVVSFGFALLLPCFDSWDPSASGRWMRAVRRMALWSYSLYLCNLLVMVIVQRELDGMPRGLIGPDLLRCALYLGGSIGCAAAVYSVFERPILRLRDRSSLSASARFPHPARAT